MSEAMLLDIPLTGDISDRIESGPKPDVVSIRRGLTLNQGLVDWRATVNGTRKSQSRTSVEDRFWSKVEKTKTCWVWRGALSPSGYGHIYFSHHAVCAHRYAYELLVGPIPTGLVIDHLCRNRACVNPDHLEPVTSAENIRRGIGPTAINLRKHRCSRGHEYTPENTYINPAGYRRCRTCFRTWDRVNRWGAPSTAKVCGYPNKRGGGTCKLTYLKGNGCHYHDQKESK